MYCTEEAGKDMTMIPNTLLVQAYLDSKPHSTTSHGRASQSPDLNISETVQLIFFMWLCHVPYPALMCNVTIWPILTVSALFSKQRCKQANVTCYYPIIRAAAKGSHTHWFSVFTPPIKPSVMLCWVFIKHVIIKFFFFFFCLCVVPFLETETSRLEWGLFP